MRVICFTGLTKLAKDLTWFQITGEDVIHITRDAFNMAVAYGDEGICHVYNN